MAKNDKPATEERNVFNYKFEEAAAGDGMVTEGGFWSARDSKVQGGPQKDKVVPLTAWLRTKKYMTTGADIKRAVEEAEKKGATLEEIAEAKEAAKGGWYYVWDIFEGTDTIVLKGQEKKVQDEGEVLTRANHQMIAKLEESVAIIPKYNVDPSTDKNAVVIGTEERENICAYKVFATGEEKVGGGAHTMHNFRFVPHAIMPLKEYQAMKQAKLFAKATKMGSLGKKTEALTAGNGEASAS